MARRRRRLGVNAMKFLLQHPNFTYDGQKTQLVDSLKTLASDAENLGFDSFWTMDHFLLSFELQRIIPLSSR
jgi:alkanesulfonate monooxygenase SsuD/methylene tetrahydromethanopterin reductase-like flavin-dependent oxidoreductase (luciferase family)